MTVNRSSDTITALSRVLIGLAWRDGEVTAQEMNLLKDLTFQMPEVTPNTWDELNIYWMTPIRERELALLEKDLRAALGTPEGRKRAYEFLSAMVNADGNVTSEETALLRETVRAVERSDADLLDVLESLLENALPRRATRLAKAPNREDYTADYMQDHVLSTLQAHYGEDIEGELGLDEYEVRKLALSGTLMGRVAYADSKLDENELGTIQMILERDWNLNPKHGRVVIEFVVDAARQPLDSPRLTREFYESTSYQDRLEFLEVLFAVAFASKGISPEESQEIESIARALKIDYADFDLARRRTRRYSAN
jgi:uncharacterized tellurite resistance protein B-like protein